MEKIGISEVSYNLVLDFLWHVPLYIQKIIILIENL